MHLKEELMISIKIEPMITFWKKTSTNEVAFSTWLSAGTILALGQKYSPKEFRSAAKYQLGVIFYKYKQNRHFIEHGIVLVVYKTKLCPFAPEPFYAQSVGRSLWYLTKTPDILRPI